ncbi:MAG TPA: hypothetical protein PLT36_03640 [Erysipelotrichaceae bacterium]|nr:hypothetical protein [Erysipelotrichaceae bacterium]HQA84576.1 hypothetical protein [Erysipelotrichaceae bacterium]
MKKIYVYFAASRYWTDKELLLDFYKKISSDEKDESVLIVDGQGIENVKKADVLIIVPMSGAVQKYIIQLAKKFDNVIIYGAYIRGNCQEEICSEMQKCNAAPTLMDCWSVLKRTHKNSYLALSKKELNDKLNVIAAYFHITASKLLLIGGSEPWVISTAKNLDYYRERFKVEIKEVSQDEILNEYEKITINDSRYIYDFFNFLSNEMLEPTNDDLINSARMAQALINVLQNHDADGCAISCFALLKTGTSMCLGVSYINDCTDMVAACEGDMDSAVTMLMMKKLTNSNLWIANPGLQPNDTVNFNHCTGPIHMINKNKAQPTILRNHHESGIGVALQIEAPINQQVTACRVSDNASKITIQKGKVVQGIYENACRTQMHILFDDYKHYLDSALGCHQVIAFEDIANKMMMLAEMFDLQLI